MNKNFYFVGCSGTYCDDIPDDQKSTHSWPALISRHRGANFVNDAMPGSSNDLIISRVLQNLKKFDRYYIQWTWENRFTVYHVENWDIVNFNQQFKNSRYGKKDYYNKFGKYYYTYWSIPIFEFKKWLEKAVLLQSILEKNNCQYLMMCASNLLWNKLIVDKADFVPSFADLHNIKNFSDDLILKHYDDIQILLEQLDMTNFIDPNQFYITEATKLFSTGNTNHPLHEGMRYTANKILEFEDKHEN